MGRTFYENAEQWVDEFGASISFDQELVFEDIEGSLAHVTMLGEMQYYYLKMKRDKLKKVLNTLEKAEEEELTFSVQYEDIHLNLKRC